MKLTPTQKNFRKQMKKIKISDDELSYKNHRKNIYFNTNEEYNEKKSSPISYTIIISFIIYMLKFIFSQLE